MSPSPVHALIVNDVSDADLPYEPLDPTGLGTPAAIWVSDHSISEALREVLWIFDEDESTVQVLERVAYVEAETAQMKQLASEHPGCKTVEPPIGVGDTRDPAVECAIGERELHTVRSDRQALLFTGPDATWITWLEPLKATDRRAITQEFGDADVGLLVVLRGPSSSLTAEEALSLAERI